MLESEKPDYRGSTKVTIILTLRTEGKKEDVEQVNAMRETRHTGTKRIHTFGKGESDGTTGTIIENIITALRLTERNRPAEGSFLSLLRVFPFICFPERLSVRASQGPPPISISAWRINTVDLCHY